MAKAKKSSGSKWTGAGVRALLPPKKTAAPRQPAKVKPARVAPVEPLWKGPDVDGITQSLIAKFLVCRHRFWLKTVMGYSEDDGFNKAIEYGSMWHVLEEHYLKAQHLSEPERIETAYKALAKYRTKLVLQYQGEDGEINKWYTLCKGQFLTYLDYWSKHQDETTRKRVLEEAAFRVPYDMPYGPIQRVYLRGKFDAVLICDRPKREDDPELYDAWMEHYPDAKQGIFLQENKSKGDIDEVGLKATLGLNLQTMLYLTALHLCYQHEPKRSRLVIPIKPSATSYATCEYAFKPDIPIVGILYNVIRRPLADRFAIKQRKGRTVKGKVVGAESSSQFLRRVDEGIASDPDHFFMRWKVLITPQDIRVFMDQVLSPILNQVTTWWDSIRLNPLDPGSLYDCKDDAEGYPNPAAGIERIGANPHHWQTPWGIYNSMFGGFRGDFFPLLTSGREAGLHKAKTLFPELE